MIVLPRKTRLLLFAMALVVLGPSSQANDDTKKKEACPFDWTLGNWRGVRKDGTSGTEFPMKVKVETILGGAGQIEYLEVAGKDNPYRGFTVQAYDAELGRWVRQYVNSVKRRFVRLEAEVEGNKSVWRIPVADSKRESRLVSEKIDPHRWVRTMSVSEDGGHSWKVIWKDDLRRME